MAMTLPEDRLRQLNSAPVQARGDYVLYWMITARRARHNPALDYAIARAKELGVGLVVLEALRCDYPYASDRLHSFVIDGMHDNAAQFSRSPIAYHGYVEPERAAGRGLLRALAQRARLVVTDDYPAFFLPRMLRAAAEQLTVRLEAVDGNGLIPMRAAQRSWPTAYAFRRHLHRVLPQHLGYRPAADPLRGLALPAVSLPPALTRRWLSELDLRLDQLPIDHSVAPAPVTGGSVAGRRRLQKFLRNQLASYAADRNHPDHTGTSGISPYLHFGHLGAHQVFRALARAEQWTPARLSDRPTGQRAGWWAMSDNAEAFVDQVVTWRELGFAACSHDEHGDLYRALPAWARKTLQEHSGDPRVALYDPAQLEAAATEDALWNAAQRQLLSEGTIHGYLRMLWGKQVLAWSPNPRAAMRLLVKLNDRYALDGRDPNSYSGISWIFGRYDRPWGPVRPVFGTVRYMTSGSALRKLRLREYLNHYGASALEGLRAGS